MRLGPIDDAFSTWKRYRSQATARDGSSSDLDELEGYMLRSIVLMIVSEYEDHLEKVFAKRAEKSNDPHMHQFMIKCCRNKFRSPDLGKIREMLKGFGGEYDQAFWKVLDQEKPQIKASWDSLMIARHAIVHKQGGGGVNLTWRDLETAFANSQLVIDELVKAIGLTTEEVQEL